MDMPWRREFEAARDPYTARIALGITSAGSGGPFQPQDADLTSIAGYSGTGTWLYRSAADTWSAVTIGSGLSFSAGTLSATAGPTYTDEQAQDATAAAFAAGTHTAITVTYNDAANSLSLVNTDRGSMAVATHEGAADPHPQYLTTAEGTAAYQPLDADLTSIAGYGGTGAWLYRSAADTWSAVSIGSGLTFTSGTLDAPLFTSGTKGEVPASGGGTANFLRADGTWTTPAGGGNVSNVGTPVDNQLAVWTAATTIEGDANLTWNGSTLTVGTSTNNGGRFRSLASGNSQFLLDAFGVDSNITLGLSSKGVNAINFYTGAFGRRQVEVVDAASPNTVLSLSGGTDSAKIATGPTPGKPINIAGCTDGSNAPAGYVGECLEAQVAHSTLTLSSGIGLAVASIALTAGDWELAGAVHFNCGSISSTSSLFAGLQPASGSVITASSHDWGSCTGFASAGFMSAVVGPIRVSLSAAQTWYINALSTFTGTVTVGGRIHARRVR